VVSFDNEQGVEMFYNFAVTPWFRVTADLQWIDPALSANDNAWVGGLRANLTF
jgi:porin